jgi:hypothetical protein
MGRIRNKKQAPLPVNPVAMQNMTSMAGVLLIPVAALGLAAFYSKRRVSTSVCCPPGTAPVARPSIFKRLGFGRTVGLGGGVATTGFGGGVATPGLGIPTGGIVPGLATGGIVNSGFDTSGLARGIVGAGIASGVVDAIF